MSLISLSQYDNRRKRAVVRVLEALDRAEARRSSVYEASRRHERIPFRGEASLCFPDPENPIIDADAPNSCRVPARSLSRSGISFIYPGPLGERHCLIGLDLPTGEQSWFHAEIVRAREVPDEDFWEYGVLFRRRAVLDASAVAR